MGLLFGIVVLLIGLVYTNAQPTLNPISQFQESEYYFHQKSGNSEKIDFLEFSGPLNFVSAANLSLTSENCIIDFTRVTSSDSVGLARFVTQAKGKKIGNLHFLQIGRTIFDISIFGQKSIFDQNFDVWPKFRFLTKSLDIFWSIFFSRKNNLLCFFFINFAKGLVMSHWFHFVEIARFMSFMQFLQIYFFQISKFLRCISLGQLAIICK